MYFTKDYRAGWKNPTLSFVIKSLAEAVQQLKVTMYVAGIQLLGVIMKQMCIYKSYWQNLWYDRTSYANCNS